MDGADYFIPTEAELAKASAVILDAAAGFKSWVEASGILTSSNEVPLERLLLCLKRRGLPAEFAAMKLYVRTGRPRTDTSPLSFIMDYADWQDYLKNHANIL